MRAESTPVLEIGTNTIHGCEGMELSGGRVTLLNDPVWRDYEGKMCWVALARVDNVIALVEVRVTKK